MPGPVARPGDTAETKRDRSTLMELSDHREQAAHQCHPERTIPSSKSTETLQHGTLGKRPVMMSYRSNEKCP